MNDPSNGQEPNRSATHNELTGDATTALQIGSVAHGGRVYVRPARSRRARWIIPLAAVGAASVATVSIWFGIAKTSESTSAGATVAGGSHASLSVSSAQNAARVTAPVAGSPPLADPDLGIGQPGRGVVPVPRPATTAPAPPPPPSHTRPNAVSNPNPPGIPVTADAPTEAVRYAGSFSLDASHESYDLDQVPFEVYGPDNTLTVGSNSIDIVVPNGARAASWSGQQAPTRQRCQEAVTLTDPSIDSFPAPQPGLVFCVMTFQGRYGFVQVNTSAPGNYNVSVTVWEK